MATNFKDTILRELETLQLADEYRKKPFQMKAYTTAIEAIQVLPSPITKVEDVAGVKGVGEKIKQKVQEIITTGKLKAAEEARAAMPLEEYKTLRDIHGIGPVKAAKLIEEGVKTIAELRAASAANVKLLTAAQKLGLKYYEDSLLRIPRAEMKEHEDVILPGLDPRFEGTVVGSYRRGAASSGDIDVLLTLPDSMTKKEQGDLFLHMIELFKEIEYIVDTLSSGPTKFLGYCQFDKKHPVRRLDLLMIPKSEYACAILYFTGSKEFNVAFRSYALEKGYTLNEHRMEATREGVPAVPPFATEEDIFEFLGLTYVEPENRRDGRDVRPL
jgi:DNA polymerase beta